MRDVLGAARRAGASRSTRSPRPRRATWAKASGSKVASSSRFTTAQDVAVERRRSRRRRRRRRRRAGRGPSRGRCRAGTRRRGRAPRRGRRGTARAGSGSRLPMVPPRNATTRVPSRWDEVEVALEVADDRVHLDAVVLRGDRRGRGARAWPRSRRRARSARAGRVSRTRRAAGASSPTCPSRARRACRPGARHDRRPCARRGCRARCGSGSTRRARVISSKSSLPAVVVEPLRRQRLR